MGYVKMPEMLSPDVIKALAGNAYTINDESSSEGEMAAAWKDYFKEDQKEEKTKCVPEEYWKDNDICCPEKVKFIFVWNNSVVINVNAVAEEESEPA
jgi:hypothetical protein